MSNKQEVVFWASCLVACGVLHGAPLGLVRNGRGVAQVVLAEQPSAVALYAAEELISHVHQASGVKLELLKETALPTPEGHYIFIGETLAARKAGIDSATLLPDGYILRVKDDNLYICGREDAESSPRDEHNNSRGTLFGVYDLLSHHLGVRWCWPGELGTYVPRTQDITIPSDLNEQRKPRLAFRTYGWRHVQQAASSKYNPKIERLAFSRTGAKRYHQSLSTYLARHGIGFSERKPDTHHRFAGWWLKYGKEHPEWFAMDKNGRRGPKEDANITELRQTSICVSNPELHKFIIEQDWNGGDFLLLGEVDRRVFCQCEKCRSWDGPQPATPPDFAKQDYEPQMVSDRYARFWQTIYEMAVKRNPNVKVTTYLYWNYLPAPLGDIKLHPGIYGEFVPWTGKTAYFPMPAECEQWLREQWMGWKRRNITIAYRPNYFHGGYVMPHISTWQSGEFFKFAYRNGMLGTRFDSLYGHWAAKGPMLYMHMRLFWNPELEIRDIRQEYFSAFGPAAGDVEHYFDYWEEYAGKRSRDTLFNPINCHRSYPEKVFAPAQQMLSEAFTIAQANALPEYAERVRFLQAGLEHARLASRFTSFLNYGDMKGYGRVLNMKYESVPIIDQQRFEECAQVLRELITFRRAHEHLFIADYLDASRRENRYFDIDTLLKE